MWSKKEGNLVLVEGVDGRKGDCVERKCPCLEKVLLC